MEIVTTILGKIGECMFESIKLQFADLRSYDDNIVALEHQLETLEKREKDVLEAIGAANRNGEIIRNTVQHWITCVESVKMGARKVLEDNVKVNKRCFRGWFPDLKTRYKLSKEAVSKSEMMKSLCEEEASFDINVSLPAPPLGIDSMTSKDFVLFQTTELAMRDVMAALRDNSTNFVGIHGMGGVGKTTLVKEIARKCKEVKLFDNVTLAVVSQTFVVENIQNQIADFLGLTLGQTSQTIRANRLCNRLKQEKKILVILDDVWASIDLATIGIPSEGDHKGCKVVITTRRRQVCSIMGRSSEGPRIVSLDVLNKHESWDLFKLQVGEIIESPTVRIVAQQLVKECGGLPIALVTVGRAMIDKDIEEWKTAALDLEKSRPTNIEDMDKNVFKCIKFSYDYLGDEEAKACFLLCCLFPEDSDIEIERLVRYGVGLNTFKGIDRIHEARRRAHSIINNLKASSLLVASGKEDCIKMHDIVRDVAKTIALDKYFVKDGEVKEWPNELGMDEYNGVGISLTRNKIQKYPDAWQCPNLKIFLTRHYDVEQVIPEEVFKGMKRLRVLDHNHSSYSERTSLEPSVSRLTNLQTLIIEWIGLLKVPIRGISALGELKMLQVLSFRKFMFEEPLDALRKLKNLRLLNFESCVNYSSIFDYARIVNEDCNFPQLEELNVIGEFMPWSVTDLIKCHPRLNVLRFCIDDVRQIPENFVFPHLDSFSISVGASLNYLSHSLENTLHLNGCYRPFDMAWLSRIGTLLSPVTILELYDLDGVRSILPYLLVSRDSLVVLKKLVVFNCGELEFLINIEEESKIPQPTCFLYLEEVTLISLRSFRGLCGMVLVDMPNFFTRLKLLDIVSCGKISNIGIPFYLLRRMRQLEHLKIESCQEIKYLFDLEGEEVENAVEEEEEGILVNLKNIRLELLSNLEQLWKGSIRLLHLRNLKTVCLIRCQKLKVVFHWSVAQRLEQLELLIVYICDELEEIVERETGEEATGLVPFRNLKNVRVELCQKLKVVFHWSVAQRLQQLEGLKVYGCKELEEIVGRETGEEAAHKVLFPELQHLYIGKLPKLVGFHIGNLPESQSNMPKLKTVHMTRYFGEPDVEIAFDGKNLDTVIKDHKELLL